jgi:hypothetical protein
VRGCGGGALLGNTKLLAESEAALAVGKGTIERRLPSAAWEKALDASPGPYSVLLISIAGFATCSAVTGGERLPFADAFLAGLVRLVRGLAGFG